MLGGRCFSCTPPPKLCVFCYILLDLLFLYLVVLCQLSVCSILATMFHFIPYPSSILFYNFASIGISYGFQAWIGSELGITRTHTHTHTRAYTHTVPMWISLPAIAVYSTHTHTHIHTHAHTHTHSTDVDLSPSNSSVQYNGAMVSLHIPKQFFSRRGGHCLTRVDYDVC